MGNPVTKRTAKKAVKKVLSAKAEKRAVKQAVNNAVAQIEQLKAKAARVDELEERQRNSGIAANGWLTRPPPVAQVPISDAVLQTVNRLCTEVNFIVDSLDMIAKAVPCDYDLYSKLPINTRGVEQPQEAPAPAKADSFFQKVKSYFVSEEPVKHPLTTSMQGPGGGYTTIHHEDYKPTNQSLPVRLNEELAQSMEARLEAEKPSKLSESLTKLIAALEEEHEGNRKKEGETK